MADEDHDAGWHDDLLCFLRGPDYEMTTLDRLPLHERLEVLAGWGKGFVAEKSLERAAVPSQPVF